MALFPIVVTAAKVAQTVYKHRKAIYAVLTAQDRYISRSFRYGGYSKATSYGVRSGALAGSVIGSVINNAEDTPGNGVQKPFQKPVKITSRKSYKTRNRYPERAFSRKCPERNTRRRY